MHTCTYHDQIEFLHVISVLGMMRFNHGSGPTFEDFGSITCGVLCVLRWIQVINAAFRRLAASGDGNFQTGSFSLSRLNAV